MLLRLTYIIKPLHLAKADQLQIEIKHEGKTVTIEIEKIPEDKRRKDYGPNDLRISAITEITLSVKREQQFLDISLPLSNSIQEFIRPIHLFLYGSILQLIKIFRWRLRNENSANPIRFFVGFSYSSIGKEWKDFPDQIRLTAIYSLPVAQQYSDTDLSEVQTLATENIHEPLGHELLQEAWELRKSNPRSALVIGLAAAETGFKQFASDRIPTASWLIENVPSPPLTKMLEHFLPNIPTQLKVYGKTLPPPEGLLKILTKGIVLRNEIVHGKNAAVKHETVEEVLIVVRDLLYLLDFYNGHLWAWQHVNPLYLNSLLASAKPPDPFASA